MLRVAPLKHNRQSLTSEPVGRIASFYFVRATA